ncbi:MAG: hypothetical protein A2Y24_08505 [Clostridiales bacterium GWE2_32_10]|nr:MAG: hypothetical protein A2Y24_08505 [Clostridiales bacterium GWE2_32_10]HBY20620.1 hypothetical protein [Clostridiales bacterium]
MKRRMMALMLVLSMVVTLFTGCTSDEMGLWNLAKETNDIAIYESNVNIDIDVEKLFELIDKESEKLGNELTTEQKEVLGKVRMFLKENSIQFVVKYDKNEVQSTIEVNLISKATGQKEAFTTVIVKDEKIYINVEQMIGYLTNKGFYNSDELLNNSGESMKYIMIDLNSIAAEGFTEFSLKNEISKSQALQEKYIDFADELVKTVFKDFSTGKVEKLGTNSYSMSMNGEEMINTLFDGIIYVINNYDGFADAVVKFINSLTDEELNQLNFGSSKEEIAQGFTESKQYVNENKAMTIAQIEQSKEIIKNEEYKPILESIKMVYLLNKQNATYSDNLNIQMNLVPIINMQIKQTNAMLEAGYEGRKTMRDFNMLGNNEENVNEEVEEPVYQELLTGDYNIGITVTSTTKAMSNLEVTAPTEGVVDIKDVKNHVKQKMNVKIDNGEFDQIVAGMPLPNDGETLDIKVVDDYSYLPMRQLAENLGEKVGWDNDMKKAYITRENNNLIYVDGIIIDDHTYIKVRELEKLGYKVNWNETTREVGIEK